MMINRDEAHNLTKAKVKDDILEQLEEIKSQIEVSIKAAIDIEQYETYINIPSNERLCILVLNWIRNFGYEVNREYGNPYRIKISWR
jgi:hypothetical protein